MKVDVAKSSHVTHSFCCSDSLMDSWVSIMNHFTLRYLFKVLRSRIGCHMLFGFVKQIVSCNCECNPPSGLLVLKGVLHI